MIYETPQLETERLILKRGTYEDFVKVYEYDFTKLRDINGIKELNTDRVYKIIERISVSEYKIDINSKNFNDYTYGGFLQVISLPIKIKYKTLEEDINNPMKDKEIDIINIPYIGRNDIVHSLIIYIH